MAEPPASVDSERAILGSLLLNNLHYFEDLADLAVNDFSLSGHRVIYEAINEMLSGVSGYTGNVDIVSLSNELRVRKKLSAVGGVSYLASLTEGLPRRPSIADWVKIVREKAQLRQLIGIGQSIVSQASDQTDTPEEVMEAAQQRLTALAAEGDSAAVHIGDFCQSVEQVILSKRNTSLTEDALDMTWGLEPVDVFTKGVFGGELTIVSGESGGYKSSLMMQVIVANALKGTPCCVFSIEMSKEQLVQRMYPLLSEVIRSSMIRDPRLLYRDHLPELRKLTAQIAKLPIWIDDTSPLTITKLIARAKMQKYKHQVRLFAVDYIQLIDVPNVNETEKMKVVSYGLRDLMKSQKDAHMLGLSQYAKVMAGKGRRTKADLYGGQVIGHAAHNVVAVTVESAAKHEADDLLDAELRFDKHRNGPTGKVVVSLDRSRFRFIPHIEEEKKHERSTGSGDDPIVDGKDRAAGQ